MYSLSLILALKNSYVAPLLRQPYWIFVCLARSSTELMGVFIRSTVKNAARLAVYDEIIIKVKNHQTLPTILPEIAL